MRYHRHCVRQWEKLNSRREGETLVPNRQCVPTGRTTDDRSLLARRERSEFGEGPALVGTTRRGSPALTSRHMTSRDSDSAAYRATWPPDTEHVVSRQLSRGSRALPLPLLATRHLDNLHLQYVSSQNHLLIMLLLLLPLLGLVLKGSAAPCGDRYPPLCKCDLDSHHKVRSVNCTYAGITDFPDVDSTVRTLWVVQC